MGAARTSRGVCFLTLFPRSETACAAEVAALGFRPVRAPAGQARQLQDAVEAFLAGSDLQVPVDLSPLTPFQQAVLEVCRRIPRGEVRTYGWIARELGKPRAARAVGQALAANPVALFVPCHRVIPSAGGTGHYSGGGPAVKRWLLLREGAPLAASLATRRAATPQAGRGNVRFAPAGKAGIE